MSAQATGKKNEAGRHHEYTTHHSATEHVSDSCDEQLLSICLRTGVNNESTQNQISITTVPAPLEREIAKGSAA